MEVNLCYKCNVGPKCCHWTDWCGDIWGTLFLSLCRVFLCDYRTGTV